MSETRIVRIGAFETVDPVHHLRDPHVLAIVRPWADVGNVGTLVLSSLESRFGARYLGRLAKPGDFYDFTRYRPTIYFEEGNRRVNRLMPQLEKHYEEKAQKKVSRLSPELVSFLRQMGSPFNEG